MGRSWIHTVVLGTALGTAACSGSQENAGSAGFCARVEEAVRRPAPATAAPSAPTVVVGAIADMPGGMNIFASADYVGNQHQVHVLFMTLLRFDERYEYQPYLARSWSFNADSTELRFRLRSDVRWHDGRPTTAEDVAFTFRRASDPEAAFPNVDAWKQYRDVTVVDDSTVVFTVEPHAGMLDPWRTTAVLPAHWLAEVPSDSLGTHPFGTECPVGNGPFRFVEHREADRWVFDANEDFPDELGGEPAFGRYVYRVLPSEPTLLIEHLAGTVDIVIAPHPDEAKRISAQSKLLHYPFRGYTFVAWNTRRPQLSDLRVRRALALAVDKAALVKGLVGGYGAPAHSGIPAMHWAHDPSAGARTPYDPDRARALLAEAGWVDRDGDGVREDSSGEPLSVNLLYNEGNTLRAQIAQLVQANLAEIGVGMETTMLEWGTMLSAIMDPSNRSFDGVVMAWLPEFELDERAFFHSDAQDGPLAFSGLNDAEIDRLLNAIDRARSREEALPLWRAYQARIEDLQPFLYLFYQERLDAVGPRVLGVKMDARGEWAGIRDWRPNRDLVALR